MWNHEQPGYDCPFCRIPDGAYNDRNQPSKVVAVTEPAYARISPKWWPNNPGAAPVIPRAGIENPYDIPDEDDLYVRDRESSYVDASSRVPYADRLAAELALPPTFRGA